MERFELHHDVYEFDEVKSYDGLESRFNMAREDILLKILRCRI